MAVFAFFVATPLLLYCGIQTFRDFRRRSWIMAGFGALLVAGLIFAHIRIIEQMAGSR